MKVDTIVTLDNNERYYLTDETEQNESKYFIGSKVDSENNLLLDSNIFEEKQENDKYYLEEVKDKDLFNYLAAIFTANLTEIVDDLEDV
jgi:hypothetical protein